MADQSLAEIPAILSRAVTLLDEGAFQAAEILAAEAYADSKRAGAFARKRDAADELILRAHRLQGDSLKIETRAKIALADAYDAAQASGEASTGGRPKSVPDGNGFTADEAGYSRKDIFHAREIRDAEKKDPGIIDRAIDARIERGFEPTKAVRNDVVKRGLGTRSASVENRGDDFYETPPEAVWALMGVEKFSPIIWEPACGKGAISRVMIEAEYQFELSDLRDRGAVNQDGEVAQVEDFLQSKRRRVTKHQPAMDMVTNPPFGIVNQFIAHAMREHRPCKIAMLLNLNAMCGTENADRNFWMDEHPPARIYIFSRRLPMMHRDGYEGPRSGSQMNCAWFIWELGKSGKYPTAPPRMFRLNWKDYVLESENQLNGEQS